MRKCRAHFPGGEIGSSSINEHPLSVQTGPSNLRYVLNSTFLYKVCQKNKNRNYIPVQSISEVSPMTPCSPLQGTGTHSLTVG